MAIIQALFISLLLGWSCAGLLLGLPLLLGYKRERYPQGLVPIALALGYTVGTARLLEIIWPAFPPVDATQWIFWSLIPALLLGFVQIRWPLSLTVQTGLHLLILVPSQLLLLSPLRESNGFSSWLLWSLLTGVFTALLCLSQELLSSRDPFLPLFNGAGVAGFSGVLLMLGHSVVLSQQALLLSGLLGAAGLLQFRFRRAVMGGRWIVPMLVLSMLWSSGRAYADLSPAILLLIPALLAPWLGQMRFLKSRPLWIQRIIPLLISFLLSALATGIVFIAQEFWGSDAYDSSVQM